MGVTIVAKLERTSQFSSFVTKLMSPEMARAAATGLNEHAAEQRRQSISRVAAFTGVPSSRMAKATKLIRARLGGSMTAQIETRDQAIGLEEYGNPHWVRDINPFADGQKGGSVSSMAGVEATAWNRRRVHRGTFFAQGIVWKRQPSGRLRKIFSTVLANELANPGWRNTTGASAFVALDLERRVLRHVIRFLD